jgi:hypothetical protein
MERRWFGIISQEPFAAAVPTALQLERAITRFVPHWNNNVQALVSCLLRYITAVFDDAAISTGGSGVFFYG